MVAQVEIRALNPAEVASNQLYINMAFTVEEYALYLRPVNMTLVTKMIHCHLQTRYVAQTSI